jgi:hypothetical protein
LDHYHGDQHDGFALQEGTDKDGHPTELGNQVRRRHCSGPGWPQIIVLPNPAAHLFQSRNRPFGLLPRYFLSLQAQGAHHIGSLEPFTTLGGDT